MRCGGKINGSLTFDQAQLKILPATSDWIFSNGSTPKSAS
ncbi:hypothetical protein FHX06_006902 [Rhizobium sp. BK512]|jgi:hypothetical protein|nr:hypothetical protein [Rhizobium sp. BK379]MBB3565532.1 hypothetical protein [Rhizobium sp. BK512]